MDMIKVLVLDDGYHDKEAVMFYDNKTLLKTSLAYFINIHLCVPHHEDYQVKTIHYEDMEDNHLVDMFDQLSCMKSVARIDDEDLVWYFQKLYDSDEVVDGCDIY
jgi:hypothetical protein